MVMHLLVAFCHTCVSLDNNKRTSWNYEMFYLGELYWVDHGTWWAFSQNFAHIDNSFMNLKWYDYDIHFPCIQNNQIQNSSRNLRKNYCLFICVEGVNLTNWRQEWIGPQVARIEQVIKVLKFGQKWMAISLRSISNSEVFNINLKNGKTNLALSSTFKATS